MNLHEALDQYREARFVWGECDCCLFVANVLHDLTGNDYAARWRGSYRTALGAARLIRQWGGVRGLATEAFGPAVPRLLARRGDPVLVSGLCIADDLPGLKGEALGICDGAAIVLITASGVMTLPLERAEAAWNV